MGELEWFAEPRKPFKMQGQSEHYKSYLLHPVKIGANWCRWTLGKRSNLSLSYEYFNVDKYSRININFGPEK